MKTCWLDWETRSVLDLEEVGIDNYLRDPSTEIILGQYAFGDGKVRIWEPHLNSKIPSDLEDAFHDPFCVFAAWGAATFERIVAQRLLGIEKPLEEWYCVMSHSRYCGLPGKLHDAGEILELGDEAKLRLGGGKTGKGSKFVKFFSEPIDKGGEQTLFGISKPIFNTPFSHPKEWKQFVEYGKGDVVSMRAAAKKLAKFPMSEEELETWRLDARINETGWPTDLLLVDNAREIALRSREPLVARIKELTGLENPNSRDQILEWVQSRGYLFYSLGKEFVARALNGECNLTPECREVLDLRSQTAKSSVSKYTALADMTAPDGRLRYQYTYYGAHTGRWAAHGVNMGNLLKPTKEVEKKLDLAITLVRKMDYEAIEREFSSALDVAAGVQRSAFRAPDGFKLVWADLNAIENRVIGYLARCEAILQVFRDGLDPYLAFAVHMFGKSYEELVAEYKAGDKEKRTVCKPPVLGGGYALGPGEERVDSKTGLRYWTGLMGYARNMGVELTQKQCTQSIKVLRESWKEVTWLWKDMERAAAFAIRHPGYLTGVGVPELKWEFDLFERLGRKVQDPLIHFKCHSDRVMEMILPSGRPLFYWSPRVETQKKVWDGVKDGKPVHREYEQDVVFYKAKDPKTKQWVETDTFGGHLVENATQAEARDILVHGMKLAEQMGFVLIGSTYDETMALVQINSNLGKEELCQCLSTPLPHHQGMLPLAAEGTEDEVYRKG